MKDFDDEFSPMKSSFAPSKVPQMTQPDHSVDDLDDLINDISNTNNRPSEF